MARAAAPIPNVRPIIVKKIIAAPHDAHHGGAWKIAYADFVTAMMAFFLLMWLLGMTDEEKRKGLADYFAPTLVQMRAESGGANGVLGGDSIVAADNYPHRAAQTGTRSITVPSGARGGILEADQVRAREDESFASVQRDLRDALNAETALRDLARHVRMMVTEEGLQIDLMDEADFAMFAVGTARLTPQAAALVRQVAAAVRPLPNGVIVRGHTDSLGYRGSSPMNNWTLSAARAGATRDTLAALGVPTARFVRIEGVADREPLSPRDRYDPRNRRISIMLARIAPRPVAPTTVNATAAPQTAAPPPSL
jgi:chemotaxis protein MotB